MNPKTIKWKLFGWHLYASRERLRFMPISNNRGNGLSRRLRELRNRRFNRKHGCCEQCGQQFDKASFQMHHILPLSEFPNFAKKTWNLMMLCPRCHYIMHNDFTQQMQLMQKTAQQHGINLQREFHTAATRRWNEKQKGGAL